MTARSADPYSTLGVSPASDPRTIERAFRRLCLRYHPDVSSEPGAGRRMREINAAYQILRDSARAGAVDISRSRGRVSTVNWPEYQRKWSARARTRPEPRAEARPIARVRCQTCVVDFGFLGEGEVAQRDLIFRSFDGGPIDACALARGDWLALDRTTLTDGVCTIRVTADPTGLSVFWRGKGRESAMIEGAVEIVDRHGSLSIPVSAILRRHGESAWWTPSMRRVR